MHDFGLELSVMAKRLKQKGNKYWGNFGKMNMLLYVGCILDPRKKLDYVRFYIQ